MSRTNLCLGVAFALTLAALSLRADDKKPATDSHLKVNAALWAGRDLIKTGDYKGAVAVLEKELGLIDGNREYLLALRDAYAGLVPQLLAAGKTDESKTYQTRLAILEPTSRAAAPAPRVPVQRGKGPEFTDPFDDSNRAGKHTGGLRELADQAFEKRNYEAAAELFAKAHRQSAQSVADCAEQWGYCRLYAVAQTINRGGTLQAADLRREVQSAAGMAPKLGAFADQLLGRLKEADAPAVSVKHTPRVNGGWAKAETANFRVFHVGEEADAERVARVAEATRSAMTRKWFGQEPAGDWVPRCDVFVFPKGADYAKATGAPATAPGHSTIEQDNGRVTKRRIDVRADDPNMPVGVLPHEATHVVLAGHFGNHYVPRWADEGMAVLSEPRERVEMHLRNLAKHQSDGMLFGVAELFGMNDYPEPRRVGPFYAQSVSLVDYLCKKKDPMTFAKFVAEALDTSYESSLRRHFGYASVADLEREWKQQVLDGASVASASQKRR